MGALQEAHHHRNTTKVGHKPFKSKHATKSLIKDLAKGKLDSTGKIGKKKPSQAAMSKLQRRNQARQLRQAKHVENARATDVFHGQHGAPRIIATIPLSDTLDSVRAIDTLNNAVGASICGIGQSTVRVDRFKQKIHYLPIPENPFAALDACRMADYVLFLLSPEQEPDSQRDTLLRAIESQGVPNVIFMVQDLDKSLPLKKHSQVLVSLKSYMNYFFPEQEKVFSLDNESECCNAVRSICCGTPKGVKWREDRGWMMVEDVQWSEPSTQDFSTGSLVVTGVVRGRGLQSNRLVQFGDWGHFQIGRITSATLNPTKHPSPDQMQIEAENDPVTSLEEPDEAQEDVSEFVPDDPIMEDISEAAFSESAVPRKGVLLDEHHYFSEDEYDNPETPVKIPEGTSSYQAAWFHADMSQSESDVDDEQDEGRDVSMDDHGHSEIVVESENDEDNAQVDEDRAQRKLASQDDHDFPDEIELHPNQLARERLTRFRGLKSLKTSIWDHNEDKPFEPEHWNRLLQTTEHIRATKLIDDQSSTTGVKAGTRVHVHIRNVPLHLRDYHFHNRALALHQLLHLEQKRSVVHCSFSLRSDQPEPLKSKSELIVQCGSRRFLVNPLFSQAGNTPNDVHKYLRFLHPGQTAVASFIAPVTLGPVPVLFFQSAVSRTNPLDLVATGTCLPHSKSRVIAKRIVLTGHPYKIHKKLVTVRYMFFNAEDVNWFKALPLWTRRGRSGFIKESLGTHGYFKATFDAKINPQDAVGISLYKRVWPRQAQAWRPA